MSVVNEIKDIIFQFIEYEYEKYLEARKILLIKDCAIREIINKLYDDNIKNIKINVRTILKEKYKENYSTSTIEGILLDIFQDKKFNINKLIDQIIFIQNKNFKELDIPIVDGSLGLKIAISNNFIIIPSVSLSDPKKNDIFDLIRKYKFLYSINDKILEEYDNKEKISIIKSEIAGKKSARLGLYYLRDDD